MTEANVVRFACVLSVLSTCGAIAQFRDKTCDLLSNLQLDLTLDAVTKSPELSRKTLVLPNIVEGTETHPESGHEGRIKSLISSAGSIAEGPEPLIEPETLRIKNKWEAMCNTSVSTAESCQHGLQLRVYSSVKVCLQKLEPMAFIDNNHWFRMNGYIPDEILGALHLQFPHDITTSTDVTLTVHGAPHAVTDVYVFYNNRTIKDVLKYTGGLENTLLELGFDGPFRGPSYDVNVRRPESWGGDEKKPELHGLPAAMWKKRVVVPNSGEQKIRINVNGSVRRPAVIGMAAKGVCETNVYSE